MLTMHKAPAEAKQSHKSRDLHENKFNNNSKKRGSTSEVQQCKQKQHDVGEEHFPKRNKTRIVIISLP